KELPADAPATVEFDDVSFAYATGEGTDAKAARPVLRGLSFEIRAGEWHAVGGPSGSGKSPLWLLLPRFSDVSHGAVLIGGLD
ncbi:ATP-binding cassette domain-containing protein, partial [Escherichia coli]|uniref:ATP-binding cassette domain-containing protein n=1 Tax=Escherichia coli TaxID=562 RepID=UPI0028DF32AC